MRVLRGPRGAGRRRAGRIPVRAVPALLLGCLLVLAVGVALVRFMSGGNGPPGPQARSSARPESRWSAPRPDIVPRAAWLGTAARRQPAPRYDDQVVAVFVHHTDTPNGYDCADAPRILRDIYSGQTGARDWDDLGYNFVVDRCGTVYEGRAGGVDRAVTGAHTQGFNHRTAGIAALGTFTEGVPVPRALTDAIAAVTAWKLGPAGTDPRGRVRLVSSNGLSRYAAGTAAVLPAVAGHDDGYQTSCPGAALSARLPAIRERAARLQGRLTTAQDGHSDHAGSSEPSPLRSVAQADRRWGP
jgi:hypothetical protein